MLLLLVTVVAVVAAVHPDSASHLDRNQRLIKLHSSPYKHHPHHKHIRPGPLGPHVHYHDHESDHHYEYIRPNRPPPIPPFVNPPLNKYLSRPPPSYNPYKLPPQGSPFKALNNFRSPAIKDHFRSPTIPAFPSKPAVVSPSFEYIPSSNHVINSDDNRGPIHEIPAPNLGPKPDSKPIYGPLVHKEEPEFLHFKEHHPHFEKEHHFEKEQHSHFEKEQHSHFEKKPSYEVVESNDKIIEQSDGTKGYYAPDPDPSLPAPKIPPTHDPHSIPSHPSIKDSFPTIKENFPTGQEYQILEAGPNSHAPIPNLSSQELYDLMHSFPNDQYTLVQTSVIPQPVLSILGQNPYQHPQAHPSGFVHPTPNSHQEIENNGLVHSSIINHQQQYQDFNHPLYQSFNYDENNPNAGAVPLENTHKFHYEQDVSETGNTGTVVRNSGESEENKKLESVKKTLPNDLSNLIPDEDYEKNFENDQSPIFKLNSEVPFYSSLPNKETAEALATLQAAGSVASQINQMRGDQNPEDDSRENGQRDLFGLPQNSIVKPQLIHHRPFGQTAEEYEDEIPQASAQEPVTVEVQKSLHTYQKSYKGKTLESATEPDPENMTEAPDSEAFGKDPEAIEGQGGPSQTYGVKIIKPK